MLHKKSAINPERLLEEIQELLETASKEYASDGKILVEIGRMQLLLNDAPGAKSYFQRAIDLNPRNMSARYLLAKILMREKDLHNALQICNQGTLLKEDEVLLSRLKLEIMHKLNFENTTIIEQYKNYLKDVPNDYFTKLCFASYLYLEGFDECADIFKELKYIPFISFREKRILVKEVDKHLNNKNISEKGIVKITTPSGFLLKTERFSSRTFVYCFFIKGGRIGDRITYTVKFNYIGPIAIYPKKIF